jgi:hypothetical protein
MPATKVFNYHKESVARREKTDSIVSFVQQLPYVLNTFFVLQGKHFEGMDNTYFRLNFKRMCAYKFGR